MKKKVQDLVLELSEIQGIYGAKTIRNEARERIKKNSQV